MRYLKQLLHDYRVFRAASRLLGEPQTWAAWRQVRATQQYFRSIGAGIDPP